MEYSSLINDHDNFIFDFDGTLVDSMHVWSSIYQDTLRDFGIEPPSDYMFKVNHRAAIESAYYTIVRFDLEVSERELREIWDKKAHYYYKHKVQLKPYARELLDKIAAAGKKIVLATALPKELYQVGIESLDILHYFDATTSLDEVTRGKSFPDIYLKAMSKVGGVPERSVVFEDSHMGVIGANKGNFFTVGVYDEVSKAHEPTLRITANAYIRNFKELL